MHNISNRKIDRTQLHQFDYLHSLKSMFSRGKVDRISTSFSGSGRESSKKLDPLDLDTSIACVTISGFC